MSKLRELIAKADDAPFGFTLPMVELRDYLQDHANAIADMIDAAESCAAYVVDSDSDGIRQLNAAIAKLKGE
jgi:hypothetical protein